jgi:hypothetical protein
VAEGCSLGTAHPPGYPFYTIIVYVVTNWLPDLGEYKAAARVNMLCSAFGAGAATILACCIRTVLLHIRSPFTKLEALDRESELFKWSYILGWICGCCGAGLWAFSPLVWQYAVTAEVFSLNNLLVALVVRQALQFTVRGGTLADASMGALYVGLSLTNQHTAVLFAFPIAVWVVVCFVANSKNSVIVLVDLVKLGVCGLVGLSFYVYLPIASRIAPHAGSWGYVEDFQGFWHHFIRADYGSIRLYSGGSGNEGPIDRTKLWLQDFNNRQSPNLSGATLVIYFVLIGALYLLFSPFWMMSDKSSEGKGAPDKGNKKKGKMNKNSLSKEQLKENASLPSYDVLNTIGPLLVLTLLFYIAVFHYLSNMPLDNPLLYGIHARFWQQPNWMMGLFAGVGIHFIFMSFVILVHNVKAPSNVSTTFTIVLVSLAGVMVAFIVIKQLSLNYEVCLFSIHVVFILLLSIVPRENVGE